MVPNCPRCQIVHGAKLSAVPNCPLLDCGAKLSAVLNCPLYTTVPNCPGAKLSTFTLRCQIVRQHGRCQIVLGAKLSRDRANNTDRETKKGWVVTQGWVGCRWVGALSRLDCVSAALKNIKILIKINVVDPLSGNFGISGAPKRLLQGLPP